MTVYVSTYGLWGGCWLGWVVCDVWYIVTIAHSAVANLQLCSVAYLVWYDTCDVWGKLPTAVVVIVQDVESCHLLKDGLELAVLFIASLCHYLSTYIYYTVPGTKLLACRNWCLSMSSVHSCKHRPTVLTQSASQNVSWFMVVYITTPLS